MSKKVICRNLNQLSGFVGQKCWLGTHLADIGDNGRMPGKQNLPFSIHEGSEALKSC